MLWLHLVIIFSASAACPPPGYKNVDLRSEFGPIRDQDSIGWCYAYAGADLVNHYLYKNKLPPDVDVRKKENMVSAVCGALDYNQPKRISDYHGYAMKTEAFKRDKILVADTYEGMNKNQAALDQLRPTLDPKLQQIQDSATLLDIMQKEKLSTLTPVGDYLKLLIKKEELESLLKQFQTAMPQKIPVGEAGDPVVVMKNFFSRGICFEKDIPSDGYSVTDDFVRTSEPFSSTGELPVIERVYLGRAMRGIENYFQSPEPNACFANQAAGLIFPGVKAQAKNLDQILQKMKSSTHADPVDDLLNESCNRYRLQKKPGVEALTASEAGGRTALLTQADAVLVSGHPVAMVYKPEVFAYSRELFSKKSSPLSSHVSSLIGKVYNCKDNREEYILRNSWGKTSCDNQLNDYRHQESPRYDEIEKEKSACIGACADETCKVQCISKRNQDWRTFNSAYPQPYRCVDGYTVIARSQLELGLRGISWIR